jgi:hypothetical protein
VGFGSQIVTRGKPMLIQTQAKNLQAGDKIRLFDGYTLIKSIEEIDVGKFKLKLEGNRSRTLTGESWFYAKRDVKPEDM